MKTRMLLRVILGLVATPALAESPAGLICDGFEGSSASDRAQRFVEFSQSIDANLSKIDPRDEECVATKLDALEEDRRAYCDSRASLGHDLAAGPLDHLTHELFSVSSDCGRPREEAEMALLDQMLPDSCDELSSSFLAYLEFRESNPGYEPISIECYRENLSQHAPSLVQTCAEGALSLSAAYVELGERVAGACNPTEKP